MNLKKNAFKSSIRISHTDYRSPPKENVKNILALSPVLLGVPTKILGTQSNCHKQN